MAAFLDGMPRYPKMHPCGLVLSRQPMHELTPTFIANKGYSTTHFDMDAVEAIGLVKMDILAQGGLAAMRDVKAMLAKRGIEVDLPSCTAWMTGSTPLHEPEHRTPNIEHRTSKDRERAPFGVRSSMFDVRCFPSVHGPNARQALEVGALHEPGADQPTPS